MDTRSPPDVPEQVDWVSAVALSCGVTLAEASDALEQSNGDVEDACEQLTVLAAAVTTGGHQDVGTESAHAAKQERSKRIRDVANTCCVSHNQAAAALDASEDDVDDACDLIIFGDQMDVDIARVQKVDTSTLRHKPAKKGNPPAVADDKGAVIYSCKCIVQCS
jgi:NACalpha-BTF3-like transcription factor